MLEYIRDTMPSINKEGYFFICLFVVITMLAFSLSEPLGWIGVLLTVWCIFFFRDPDRIIPEDKDAIVSPADGVITSIKYESEAPKELGLDDAKFTKISIFLSVFNVHVNRIPIEGKIKKLHYHNGKFFNATLDKSSIHNERQSILLELSNGVHLGLVQVAGMIARRIVCNLEEGQKVKTGERFGIIRFGSRVDIYAPKNIKILVSNGQTMIGGETIIAKKID